MKVLIIGGGLNALESAIFFMEQGAQVRVLASSFGHRYFDLSQLSSFTKKITCHKSWDQLISSRLAKFSGNIEDRGLTPSYFDFTNNFIVPLKEKFRPYFREAQIKRVHKRFLNKDEKVPEHSRLIDLFRAVFEVDVKSAVENEESRELLSKIGPEVLSSLGESYESYEDFDFVIDASETYDFPKKMGPSGVFALNEKSLQDQNLFYGHQGLNDFYKKREEFSHVAIVGSGRIATLACLALTQWLKQEKNDRRITVITTESSPFEKFFKEEKQKDIAREMKKFLDEQISEYQKKIDLFEDEMMEWKMLDDFVRVKKVKPQVPQAKFHIYQGVNVTSLDRLIDRDGLFVTMEAPSFRSHNLEQDLKTLSVDAILVATGHQSAHQSADQGYLNLLKNEEGVYFVQEDLKQKREEKLHSIFNDMKRFFTRSGEFEES